MKKLLNKTLAIIPALLFTFSISAFACTHIVITAKDGAVVVARTLEFGPDLQSQIVTTPRGTSFANKAPNGKQSYSWTGKYGFIFLNYFQQEHPVDGMNEKGLSTGILYLPGETKYEALTDKNIKHAIPYYQFTAWVLSSFSTVAEVKAALPKMTVFDQKMAVSGQGNVTFPVHAIITDASGKSIVVEWINGKEHVYDSSKLGLLTNDPSYDWQVTNLKNYANLSPYAPTPITIDGVVYSGTGQGSGMVGLPGDTTPPSRFVKMAFFTKTAVQPTTAKEAVVLANNIIGAVYFPYGSVRSTKAEGLAGYETVQWTVVKDLTNRVLYFKTDSQPMLQSIDLKQIDFSKGASVLSISVINHAPLSVDITKAYQSSKIKE